jgi:hypothetical protein
MKPGFKPNNPCSDPQKKTFSAAYLRDEIARIIAGTIAIRRASLLSDEYDSDIPSLDTNSATWDHNRVYQDLLIGRPGIQPEPKVMQANADLHHHITRGVLPEPDRVFHNP